MPKGQANIVIRKDKPGRIRCVIDTIFPSSRPQKPACKKCKPYAIVPRFTLNINIKSPKPAGHQTLFSVGSAKDCVLALPSLVQRMTVAGFPFTCGRDFCFLYIAGGIVAEVAGARCRQPVAGCRDDVGTGVAVQGNTGTVAARIVGVLQPEEPGIK